MRERRNGRQEGRQIAWEPGAPQRLGHVHSQTNLCAQRGQSPQDTAPSTHAGVRWLGAPYLPVSGADALARGSTPGGLEKNKLQVGVTTGTPASRGGSNGGGSLSFSLLCPSRAQSTEHEDVPGLTALRTQRHGQCRFAARRQPPGRGAHPSQPGTVTTAEEHAPDCPPRQPLSPGPSPGPVRLDTPPSLPGTPAWSTDTN